LRAIRAFPKRESETTLLRSDLAPGVGTPVAVDPSERLDALPKENESNEHD